MDRKFTFVIIPNFETTFNIGAQAPISCVFFGNGRLCWVIILNASILISIMLLRNAKIDPSGKPTMNNVINPY